MEKVGFLVYVSLCEFTLNSAYWIERTLNCESSEKPKNNFNNQKRTESKNKAIP